MLLIVGSLLNSPTSILIFVSTFLLVSILLINSFFSFFNTFTSDLFSYLFILNSSILLLGGSLFNFPSCFHGPHLLLPFSLINNIIRYCFFLSNWKILLGCEPFQILPRYPLQWYDLILYFYFQKYLLMSNIWGRCCARWRCWCQWRRRNAGRTTWWWGGRPIFWGFASFKLRKENVIYPLTFFIKH